MTTIEKSLDYRGLFHLDKRLNALETWITADKAIELEKIETASADASFRRYFRVHLSPCKKFNNASTVIVMDAPPEHEDNALFIKCAQTLTHCGLHAPAIFNSNLEQGFLLIEDLGTLTYQAQLENGSTNELYTDAIQALIKLQSHTSTYQQEFQPYDAALLQNEMSLFEQWYVNTHLNKKLSSKQKKLLDDTFTQLIGNAQEQPQVLVHRDYHCRNLLLTTNNNPGVIDFQDMVVGPITYDLVSLFKDCYLSWPRQQVKNWVENARLSSIQAELITPNTTSQQWLHWFDFMGVQRHLKVLGIFARLNHRDNKPQYLDDLPLVNQYLKDACSYYEELQPLGLLLDDIHN